MWQTGEHQSAAARVRDLLATYGSMEDLIQLGAYERGSSPELDRAIQLMPACRTFLQQQPGEVCSFEETTRALSLIAQQWQPIGNHATEATA